MTREELQRLYDRYKQTGRYSHLLALANGVHRFLEQDDPTVEIAHLKAKLAAFAAEHGEVRLARTDDQGTSAMYYDWLPPTQQEGGWDDAAGLIYMQRGFLRRDRFADLYDLLDADIDAEVPDDMLVPFEDAGAES